MKTELHRIKEITNQLSQHIRTKFVNIDKPIIISIGGPGGSGKSTLAVILAKELGDSRVLSLDNYRKSRKERKSSGLLGSNPGANNIDLLKIHLNEIKNGNTFESPFYKEVTGENNESVLYKPGKYNIIEGELTLDNQIAVASDYKIVLQCGLITQLKYRLMRDTGRRKYVLTKAIKVFIKSNIKDYKKFYKINESYADVIIKRMGKSSFKLLKGL